ncbi:MAG TPA: BON domain-containing protein [Burkholderiaceae bacterium]|nr:BON domain-containing protein [Burkholderiaceae bacterium]
MTKQSRPLQLGLAVAAALAGLALAGCEDKTPASEQVSAGTHLDDAVITTKVKSTLMADSLGKGGDTSVETRKGEVMLSGFVDNQAQADREVQLAKGVEGVTAVDNKLMIKDGKSTAGNVLDDSVVTVKVKSALLADDATRGTEFAVTTNKGVVQLSGYVDSADEQARATSVARTVEGVQSVVNDTSIKK